MASRELKVEIIGDASSLERAFGRADKATGRLGSSSTRTSKAMGLLKGGLVGVGLAAAGALAVGFKRGFEEMLEAQKVTAQTEAVLKSTGGQANVTGKQVEGLAGQLSALSGVDDEVIQSGENLLLTFTNIRNEVGKGNDIFNQATKAALDMSVALGQDMQSSVMQLGKALNDPIKGMSALQRVGVAFTKGQKETIKSLVDSGRSMDAQKLILRELTKEFGGSAKAAGDTLPGQLNKLKNAFDEAAAKLVEKLLPYLMRFVEFLNKNMPAIEAAVGSAFDKIGEAITTVSDAFNAIRPVLEQLMPVVKTFMDFFFTSIFTPLKVIAALLTGEWGAAWEAAKAPVLALVDVLGSVYTAVIQPLLGQFTELASGVGAKVNEIVGFFTELPGRLLATVTALVSTALTPFQNAFTAAKDWVMARVDEIVGFFTALPGRIFATVAGLISTALEPFQTAFTTAKTWVGNRIDDIVAFFTALPGRILATIAGLITTALTPFQEAFTTAKNTIVNGLTAILSFFRELPGKIAATIGALISTGLEPFKAAFLNATGPIMTALSNIKSAIEWLGAQAGNVLQEGVGAITTAAKAIADAFGPLASILGSIVSAVRWLIDNIKNIPTPSFPDLPNVPGIPGIAKGGPVKKSQLYVVGEKGPELFVSESAGTVFNASDTAAMLKGAATGGGGGGGAVGDYLHPPFKEADPHSFLGIFEVQPSTTTVHVNLTGSFVGNEQQLARVLTPAIRDQLRRETNRGVPSVTRPS